MEDFRTKAGLTLGDLGASARTLFFALNADRNPEEWHTISEEKRDRWNLCVAQAVDQCQREADCTWSSLAAKMFNAFHKGQHTFVSQPEIVRLQWEALARHLVNMITTDDTEGLKSLAPTAEDYWTDWLIGKLHGEKRGDPIMPEDEYGDEPDGDRDDGISRYDF